MVRRITKLSVSELSAKELSDNVLIQASIDGEDEAFRILIERYQGLVSQLVWRIVSEDQEEVCQDVFLKVYFNLEKFRFDSKFSTWLYTVAYRTAISTLRKKRLATESFEVARHDEASGIEARDLVHGEISQELERAMSQLSVGERTIITLFHFHGCSIDEIAKITEKPSGTLKSLLFRIRNKMKRRLNRGLIQELGEIHS